MKYFVSLVLVTVIMYSGIIWLGSFFSFHQSSVAVYFKYIFEDIDIDSLSPVGL